MTWEEFLTILVIVFSLVMIVAGLFAAYFGSGKSRKVGVALFGIGLVLGIAWLYLLGVFTGGDKPIPLLEKVEVWDLIYNTAVTIVAALVGALAAVGIFLVAVMKS
jgi:low affinity Fe/Cu permease